MKNSILALFIFLMLASVGSAQSGYVGNWESLSTKDIPEWMQDAKFGIYTHWSLFSVPAHGGPDYVKNLYGGPEKDAKGVYSYHVEKYGPVEEFGYVDFVPQFTAPKFKADEWVDLMYESGARFGGILLVHHDGFCLWDSEHTRWNSMDKGPRKDIYGEIANSVRRYDDMKLLATFHHGRTFGYATGFEKNSKTPEAIRKKWDVYNPELNDFYWNERAGASVEEFGRQWNAKIKEVIDNYSPDCIWFDGLNQSIARNAPSEQEVQDMFAYYYNQGNKKGQDVIICNKHAGKFNFPDEFGMKCYENGREMPRDVGPWFLIDRAIAYPWAYVNNKRYRDGADYHTRSLIDLVSRGGVFLLSLTPKGDGSIPDEEIAIMKGIGRWMKVNHESIRSTRPWKVYAEGPTDLVVVKNTSKEGVQKPGWDYRKKFTSQDIRFTQSKDGKTVYAITMDWPEETGKIVIKNLKEGSEHYTKKIESVEMIGVDAPVRWERTAEGLEITFPQEKPNNFEWAYAFKIK